jgi:hypothetical protein
MLSLDSSYILERREYYVFLHFRTERILCFDKGGLYLKYFVSGNLQLFRFYLGRIIDFGLGRGH